MLWSQGANWDTSFLDFWVLWPKFVKFLMSILKRQVSSSSTFVSFFIFMAHNSSVNFKVIHFLLWTKESHQSSNFDIFECSGENLPFLSCHFPNDKSVFLQVLHRYWMLWKTNPLYIFSSKKYTLLKNNPLKWKCLRLLIAQINFCSIPSANFQTTSRFLSIFSIFHHFHER